MQQQQQTEKLVSDMLARLQYKYKDMTKRDIVATLGLFKELSPTREVFTYANGKSQELISLRGTIPVKYRNISTYNIPVQLFIVDTHPYTAPMCYVRPTVDMKINVSECVDSNGFVMLPCIKDWKYPQSDISLVIYMMTIRFAEETPVFAVPRGAAAAQTRPTNVYTPTSDSSNSESSLPYPVNNTGIPSYPHSTVSSNPSSGLPYPSQPYASGYPYPATSYASNSPYYPMPTGNTASTSTVSQTQPPRPPAYVDDTIKPEYYKMSLISAIEDKVRVRLKELMEARRAEIDSLARVKQDLEAGSRTLNSLIAESQREQIQLAQATEQLKRKTTALSDTMHRIEHRDKTNIEDAVVPTRPIYRQIMELFAEEQAIQDLIFYLSEGLNHKTITLESFLKQVRALSRKQFMLRATMQKAREKAGLSI